jgi:signal transduction histidine kinase
VELSGNLNNFFHYLECAGLMAFLLRDFTSALEHLERAEDLALQMGGAMPCLPFVTAHAAMAIIGLLPFDTKGKRRKQLITLARHRNNLQGWSRLNPANFRHLERLVSAAWQRVIGHPEKALPLCEETVSGIRAQGGELWLPYEALALELAGECLLSLRCDAMARDRLCRAMRTWSQYGAGRLVQERENHYGHLVQGWNQMSEESLSVASGSITSDRQDAILLVDYPSLLRASQSIASETSLDGVVSRLLFLTLANAGAEQAHLFLPQNGEWILACAGQYQSGEVVVNVGNPSAQDRPEPALALVRYVVRSRRVVVLDDASTDGQWSHLFRASCSLLCTPLFHTGEVMGVLLLENTRSKGVFTQERMETVTILGTQAAISLTNARVMEEQREHLHTIRRLGAHLDQLSEMEKRRLASEVHDELGSILSAAKISLSLLGKRQQNEADRQRCQEVYQLTSQALRSVRRISHSLRPDVLDLMGLRAALVDLAGSTQSHAGIECRLVVAEENEWPLDEAKRTALYRIAQESLTNVVRHAGATKVVITLREERGVIVLEVKDDGCGIAVERSQDVGSFGLAGMRERAGRLGGNVEVVAVATGGTRVTARVPIYTQGKDLPQ